MSKSLTEILRVMRQRIQAERFEHRAIRASSEVGRPAGQPTARMPEKLRQKVRPVQRKLKMLVPLYRSLNALAQQTEDGSVAEKQYVKRYREVASQLGFVARGHTETVQLLLGTSEVFLLVPQQGMTPTGWPVKSLSELFQDAVATDRAFHALRQQRLQSSMDARAKFLQSLDATQRELLGQAVAAATEASTTLTINKSDLAA